jgi:hypothetical protein
VSGTGRGFESPPLRKHKRWQQAQKKMKLHSTISGLLLGTILLFSSCDNEKLKIDIDTVDIETIELNDRFGNFIKTDSGEITVKTFKLDSIRYSDFLNDINDAEKVGLRKLLVCYSINIRTKDNKEIKLRGRGDLITISPDDIYYQIDKDILKIYWDIDQGEFCKPTTPVDK